MTTALLVLQETMRKHPPVNCNLGLARIPLKDTMLGGFFIPKGVPVVCNSFGMVRDPKIFPRPDVSTPLLVFWLGAPISYFNVDPKEGRGIQSQRENESCRI